MNKIKNYLIAGIILLLFSHSMWAQCNGYPELCDRRYDEVAYLTTHNAYNTEEDNFNLPNQNLSLTHQLEDGVRGFMLDVYNVGGVLTVYHGFALLGTATFASNLTEIKTFMDAHPNEIVTIILECNVTANEIEGDLTAVGLMPNVFAHNPNDAWPTLQEMIDANKRLVILSDKDDADSTQNWYHYVWDYAVETGFSVNDASEFNCDFNRGDSINDLFILNHFVTDANLGVGVPAQATIVNETSFFYDRAVECMNEKQKFPNFPTVDFHDLGNTAEVVEMLNAIVWVAREVPATSGKAAVTIWPNPTRSNFNIEIVSLESGPVKMDAFDLSGRKVATIFEGELAVGTNRWGWDGNTPGGGSVSSGMYFICVTTEKFTETIKAIRTE